MKTLKITEEAHKDLTIIILETYKQTGFKMTYSELIVYLTMQYHQKRKEEK